MSKREPKFIFAAASPEYIALDEQHGEIWTSCGGSTNGIAVYNMEDGSAKRTLDIEYLHTPRGLAFDPVAGRFVISDGYKHLVMQVDESGKHTDTIGDTEAPCGIAVDTRGRVLVCSGRAKLIEIHRGPDGRERVPRDYDLRSPSMVTIDAQGRIAVSDTEANRVLLIKVDGSVETVISSDEAKREFALQKPFGVAFDASGNIVVTDYSPFVYVFNSAGKLVEKFGGAGSEPGQFRPGPKSVAVDSKGNIYICDKGNGRVQVF